MESIGTLIALAVSFLGLLESYLVKLNIGFNKSFESYERFSGMIRCRISLRRIILCGACFLFSYLFVDEQFEFDLLADIFGIFFILSVFLSIYHMKFKQDRPNKFRTWAFLFWILSSVFFLVVMVCVRLGFGI